jgi:hypothetical protein
MQIYTGNAHGEDIDEIKALGMGVMICTTPAGTINKAWKGLPLCLDNGAFGCWLRGFPFMADAFRKTLSNCYASGLTLNFLVCPDLVARGRDSLRFSMSWANGELLSCGRLALPVQDGMTTKMVALEYPERRFATIFVGGTKGWKWDTAHEWVSFAHERGMKCHIGRCGTLDRLKYAYQIGADSVDSTNFVRNKSWDVVREYMGQSAQMQLMFEAVALDDVESELIEHEYDCAKVEGVCTNG